MANNKYENFYNSVKSGKAMNQVFSSNTTPKDISREAIGSGKEKQYLDQYDKLKSQGNLNFSYSMSMQDVVDNVTKRINGMSVTGKVDGTNSYGTVGINKNSSFSTGLTSNLPGVAQSAKTADQNAKKGITITPINEQKKNVGSCGATVYRR